MQAPIHLEAHPHREPDAVTAFPSRALLLLLLSLWLFGPVAIAQCNSVLQSAGPIATVRGQVKCSVLWDPDGAGPLTTWLVVGGVNLTGGDQLAPVGVLAYDGAQWRGVGFDVAQEVRALAVFNGELIAAGLFVLPTAGGSANNIARRNVSSWQPLGVGMDGDVLAMTVFAGELVAGGGFSQAGGVQTGRIAKWNGASWSALAGTTPTFFNGSIRALVTFGSLYVGGFFMTPVGHGLVRWNGTTWSAAGSPSLPTNFGSVDALTAFIGTTQGSSFLVAAGSFTNIGGAQANNVARAGSGATTWSAMGTGLPQLGSIQLLTNAPFLGTPEVIATGSINNNTVRAMRWNGTAWSPLGNLGPATGFAAATGPRIYGTLVAGLNDAATAPRAPSMFWLFNDWTPLSGGLASPVQCLVGDGPDVIVGGAFSTIGFVSVNGIARRSGTTWSSLGTGMTGGTATVLAVVRASNGDIFAGGSFTTAGGNAASNVARWNGSAWAPLGTGTNGTVRALRLAANGDLLAGGDFTSAGGVVCNRIARWNGTAWSQLSSGMNDSVRCLAQLNSGEIVAGGTFTLAGGVACSRIARWNGISWSQMNIGMNDAVNALVLRSDGVLIAGGAFTTVGGGFAVQHVVHFSGTQWLSLSFGVPGTVNALLALPDGDVLIGGSFASGGMNHVARYNRFNNTIGGVGNGVDGPDVFALAAARNGDVFIGGDFDAVLPNQAAGHLAILTTNCPASATPVATACVGPGGPVSLVANTLPWTGSTFRSTASGLAPQSIAISVLGFTPLNLPLSAVLPAGLPNCNLLASPDELILAVPVVGSSQYQFAVPDNPVFAGLPLSHQFVQLQFGPSGIASLSSSNALALVIGLL